MKKNNIQEFLVHLDTPLKKVVECMEKKRKGVVIVVDADEVCQGFITDGDIRRAYINRIDLRRDAEYLLAHEVLNPKHRVLFGKPNQSDAEYLAFIRKEQLRHLPILDEGRHVLDLVVLRDLLGDSNLKQVKAVIMAGGYGTRLKELTVETPKPMLSVGDKPLLENIVKQLKDVGIGQVEFTTHYKADVISEYFGNGSGFGVDIGYTEEKNPLGTAGSLKLMADDASPMLVMNGDIVTGLDYKSLVEFHNDHKADITVCVREYDFEVPYGVVHCEDGCVKGLQEKPKVQFFVNAGIYVVEHHLKDMIPAGERFDMTDLIDKCIEKGLHVASFPIIEYWLDIGNIQDYDRAVRESQNTEAAVV